VNAINGTECHKRYIKAITEACTVRIQFCITAISVRVDRSFVCNAYKNELIIQ